MKIKCVAVDDEPLALRQISGYIGKTPFLELAAECQSALEAIEILENKSIQLLFIDINMPDLSGMEFVKSLTDKPFVVFTTAYSEYAVEGFKVDAVDYLLKPISYSSFLKAANKAKDLIELKLANTKETIKKTSDHLFVKSEHKVLRIELADIKYIESMHEYVRIHQVNEKPVMKSIEAQLPPDRFMRVHRSYIVNLEKVKMVERNRIIFDKTVFIPISDQYKEQFQNFLNNKF
jgi:DNA-binding LytR/AlgR family response regulator